MPADRGSRGHYFLAVKHNQPTLLEDITAVWDGAPAWNGAPPAPPQAVQIGQHGGRVEQRRLWASDLLVGYSDWPHLAQVCKIERIVRKKNVTGREVAYAVTSLPPQEADAGRLLALWRGHWGIENRVHWVRDVTFDEDRSQVRTGSAPQIMAALRNVAISVLRLAGETNIAAALRRCPVHPSRPLALIGAPPK